ncbi:MAG TPA: zinc ribbon domain-containing protein [Methanomicrobia archaeon]|nr:zinc ribbon domain-containing protein [Methanomicrobia archaeon]
MTQDEYRGTTKEDWMRTMVSVTLFAAITIIGAILLVPSYWYIWLVLVAVSLLLLLRWHAHTFAYRCANCGHEFELSAFADLISPHGPGNGGGWKYLRCPNCHKRSRATVIRKHKN